MVLTLTKYRCEICGSNYDSIERANDCEAKGIVKPFPHLVGLMYPYNVGNMDHRVILAIPPLYGTEDGIKSVRTKHWMVEKLWAARCNSSNSFGDNFCGGGNFMSINYIINKPFPQDLLKSQHCLEMMRFLESQGILPKYVGEDCSIITTSSQRG